MRANVTVDSVIRALAEELAAVLGGKLGGSPEPGAIAIDSGWLASVELGGTPQGRASAWFEQASAAELARVVLKTDATPGDEAVLGWLRDLLSQGINALPGRAAFAGLEPGVVTVAAGPSPAGAQTFELSVENKPVGVLVVSAVLTSPASSPSMGDARLDAVLDVDLPLVVRFGRTVMPLRALADLGPGSVVDMGRSPDEPVELLVGDRLIARGEVVIVGGNYGVRITELMNGSRHESDQEARA